MDYGRFLQRLLLWVLLLLLLLQATLNIWCRALWSCLLLAALQHPTLP